MKNALIILFVMAICLSSGIASAQDAAKATLAWKFENGDQFSVEFDQKQDVLTRIDARDRALKSEMTLGCDWKVIEVAGNGNATIEQTINRVRILTGAPGAEVKKIVDVDTDSEKTVRGVSRDLKKLIEPLVGLKFTIEMTPAGEVVSVKPDANVAAVVGAFPATSALPRLFTAGAMTKLVSDSACVLAEKEVGKGDSWNEESQVSMTANDTRAYTFDRIVKSTVASLDANSANIDVGITLTQGPAPAGKVSSALTSSLELLSFTGSGKILFDRSAGIVASSEVTSQTVTRVIYRQDQVKTTIDATNRLTVSRK